jgi:diacylglycerol kinase (ATP)
MVFMSARLLLNPTAGRGRGARLRRRLERLSDRAGLVLEESSSTADLTHRARRAADEGIDRLLVAGGDGTWHHAAEALAGSATALAPIPAGTGNDLARALGYPRDPAVAFAAALHGEPGTMDLGVAGERTFCGVAGAGFDAAVAEYARTRIRRLRGPAVYAWATLATLRTYRPPRAEVASNGDVLTGEFYLVAFANTPFFGGGMRLAPGADPTDGQLEMIALRRLSRLRLLALFPRVYSGRHLGHPAVVQRTVSGSVLRFDRPQGVAGDGEALGTAGPAGFRFAVRRGALAVIRARLA